MQYGILFIFCLFYEYSNLEYVHNHVIYRVHQAEYVIHVRVAASQEYVNTYSSRRGASVTVPYPTPHMFEVLRDYAIRVGGDPLGTGSMCGSTHSHRTIHTDPYTVGFYA